MTVAKTTKVDTQVNLSQHLYFNFVICRKLFPVISQQSLHGYSIQNKGCSGGVTCVFSLCPMLLAHGNPYLVSVVFGTVVPISIYIFGKCFYYLFVHFFCCITVPYRRLSFSMLSQQL